MHSRNYWQYHTHEYKRNALIHGILPKGPYPPRLRMTDRALLVGYPRNVHSYHFGPYCTHLFAPIIIRAVEITYYQAINLWFQMVVISTHQVGGLCVPVYCSHKFVSVQLGISKLLKQICRSEIITYNTAHEKLNGRVLWIYIMSTFCQIKFGQCCPRT